MSSGLWSFRRKNPEQTLDTVLSALPTAGVQVVAAASSVSLLPTTSSPSSSSSPHMQPSSNVHAASPSQPNTLLNALGETEGNEAAVDPEWAMLRKKWMEKDLLSQEDEDENDDKYINNNYGATATSNGQDGEEEYDNLVKRALAEVNSGQKWLFTASPAKSPSPSPTREYQYSISAAQQQQTREQDSKSPSVSRALLEAEQQQHHSTMASSTKRNASSVSPLGGGDDAAATTTTIDYSKFLSQQPQQPQQKQPYSSGDHAGDDKHFVLVQSKNPKSASFITIDRVSPPAAPAPSFSSHHQAAVSSFSHHHDVNVSSTSPEERPSASLIIQQQLQSLSASSSARKQALRQQHQQSPHLRASPAAAAADSQHIARSLARTDATFKELEQELHNAANDVISKAAAMHDIPPPPAAQTNPSPQKNQSRLQQQQQQPAQVRSNVTTKLQFHDPAEESLPLRRSSSNNTTSITTGGSVFSSHQKQRTLSKTSSLAAAAAPKAATTAGATKRAPSSSIASSLSRRPTTTTSRSLNSGVGTSTASSAPPAAAPKATQRPSQPAAVRASSLASMKRGDNNKSNNSSRSSTCLDDDEVLVAANNLPTVPVSDILRRNQQARASAANAVKVSADYQKPSRRVELHANVPVPDNLPPSGNNTSTAEGQQQQRQGESNNNFSFNGSSRRHADPSSLPMRNRSSNSSSHLLHRNHQDEVMYSDSSAPSGCSSSVASSRSSSCSAVGRRSATSASGKAVVGVAPINNTGVKSVTMNAAVVAPSSGTQEQPPQQKQQQPAFVERMMLRTKEREESRKALLKKYEEEKAAKIARQIQEAEEDAQRTLEQRSKAAKLRERMQNKMRAEEERKVKVLELAAAQEQLGEMLHVRHFLGPVAFFPWRRMMAHKAIVADEFNTRMLMRRGLVAFRRNREFSLQLQRTVHVTRCIALARLLRRWTLRFALSKFRKNVLASKKDRQVAVKRHMRTLLRRWRGKAVRVHAVKDRTKELWAEEQSVEAARFRERMMLRLAFRRWVARQNEKNDERIRQSIRSKMWTVAMESLNQ